MLATGSQLSVPLSVPVPVPVPGPVPLRGSLMATTWFICRPFATCFSLGCSSRFQASQMFWSSLFAMARCSGTQRWKPWMGSTAMASGQCRQRCAVHGLSLCAGCGSDSVRPSIIITPASVLRSRSCSAPRISSSP